MSSSHSGLFTILPTKQVHFCFHAFCDSGSPGLKSSFLNAEILRHLPRLHSDDISFTNLRYYPQLKGITPNCPLVRTALLFVLPRNLVHSASYSSPSDKRQYPPDGEPLWHQDPMTIYVCPTAQSPVFHDTYNWWGKDLVCFPSLFLFFKFLSKCIMIPKGFWGWITCQTHIAYFPPLTSFYLMVLISLLFISMTSNLPLTC